jgi:hypothetical protein
MSKQQGEFREVVFELGKETRRVLRRILASLGRLYFRRQLCSRKSKF